MNCSGTTVLCIVTLFINFHFVRVKSCEQQQIPKHHGHHKQPHIIFIMADDMGWNDVSFHGSDQIPTPNIDAVTTNGILLNRYYSQSICTPSRTAYLTGRYPFRSGMQGNPLRVGERWGIPLKTSLFPEHLRNLGYTTRLVGKWHVGYYTDEHTPTRRGFDSFFGYYSGYIKYFNHTIKDYITNTTGYDLHRNTPYTSSTAKRDGIYFTDLITREVEEIIREHDVSKPLYLHVAHLAPHSGEPDDPLEVPNMAEVNETFGYIKDIDRRKYAGMVSRLDKSVGRTVRALNEAGMLENSIVIFVSDNGAPTFDFLANHGSNYPLRGQKMTLFEGGVRTVACIYSPLLNNAPRVSHELMHITDWMPTLYSAAGGNVETLGEIDGVNQWPTLKYGKRSPRDSLIVNIDEVLGVSAVISGDYKLLKGFQPLYTGFYGDDGIGNGYPVYNPKSVLTSDAGKAIAEISERVPSPQRIIQLRKEAKIFCPPHDKYANCTDKCLFDLTKDPCETVDISAEHPEVVRNLEKCIASYSKFLLPQSTSTYDPNASADKFGGVWMPWVGFNWNSMTEYYVSG